MSRDAPDAIGSRIAMMRASLPSEAEIEQMALDSLSRARKNPNCFNNWFPAVEALGIRAPASKVIEMPQELIKSILDERPTAEAAAMAKSLEEQIRAFGDEYGYPLFIKNNFFSAKHSWIDTCFIESADSNILANVATLTYEWAVVGHMPAGDIIVRKFIEAEPAFKAFNDMPITAEFRLFAADGRLEGWQPYWPKMSIEEPDCDDWEQKLERISQAPPAAMKQMEVWAKAITKKLGGHWSVDFLLDAKGECWLIDMAEGSRSFKCKTGYREFEADTPVQESPDFCP